VERVRGRITGEMADGRKDRNRGTEEKKTGVLIYLQKRAREGEPADQEKTEGIMKERAESLRIQRKNREKDRESTVTITLRNVTIMELP
jgi:hypothetical protein